MPSCLEMTSYEAANPKPRGLELLQPLALYKRARRSCSCCCYCFKWTEESESINKKGKKKKQKKKQKTKKNILFYVFWIFGYVVVI